MASILGQTDTLRYLLLVHWEGHLQDFHGCHGPWPLAISLSWLPSWARQLHYVIFNWCIVRGHLQNCHVGHGPWPLGILLSAHTVDGHIDNIALMAHTWHDHLPLLRRPTSSWVKVSGLKLPYFMQRWLVAQLVSANKIWLLVPIMVDYKIWHCYTPKNNSEGPISKIWNSHLSAYLSPVETLHWHTGAMSPSSFSLCCSSVPTRARTMLINAFTFLLLYRRAHAPSSS